MKQKGLKIETYRKIVGTGGISIKIERKIEQKFDVENGVCGVSDTYSTFQ